MSTNGNEWGNTSQNFVSAQPDTLHKADYTDLIEDLVYRLHTIGAYIALTIKYRLD